MKKKNILWVCGLIFLTSLSPTLYAQQKGQIEPGQQPSATDEIQPGKISLDIKGMDIIDVLKILAMRGNLSIVAGKNVRGKVTVFLKNVDTMDALEIILIANDLAYEKRGEIINVMTEKDYERLYGERSYDKRTVKIIQVKFAKAAGIGKSLTQIKTKIGKVIIDEDSNTVVLIDVPQKIKEMEEAIKSMDLPTVTKTFILNYAKVKDLEDQIKESLTKNIGELKIDERMNKIIVTDLPRRVDSISRMISTFDERDKVVLIEAKIVQITLSKDVGYGINWNNVFAGIDTIVKSDLAINLSGVTAPTAFTYTRAHGATEYGDRVILKLLHKLGKTDVLSTPRITVANNQEAKVLVGTKKPYVTSTITQSNGVTTTADSVEFVNVGVSLSVTPTITEDGYINMKIKPEVSSAPTSLELINADKSVRTSVPIVTTSEAETQLLVKDGTTIILAGLMKDIRKDNSDKIPILGDIPLLGYVFRSRGQEQAKTELVIFITPHIIKEGEDLSEDAEEYLREHEDTGIKAEDKPAYRPLSKFRAKEKAFSDAEEYIREHEDVGVKAEDKPSYRPLGSFKAKEKVFSVSTEIIFAPRRFYRYCRVLVKRINRIIQKNKPAKVKEQNVHLAFILTSDGYLKEQPRVLSDVDGELKNLIIRSINEALPFYPFPENCNQSEETFRIAIHFEENP